MCFFAVEFVKDRLKIDDSLDVFAVHGIGGLLGTLLVALLATEALGGGGLSVSSGTVGSQLGVQALGAVATVAWAGGFSYVIIKVTARAQQWPAGRCGLRRGRTGSVHPR